MAKITYLLDVQKLSGKYTNIFIIIILSFILWLGIKFELTGLLKDVENKDKSKCTFANGVNYA